MLEAGYHAPPDMIREVLTDGADRTAPHGVVEIGDHVVVLRVFESAEAMRADFDKLVEKLRAAEVPEARA